MVEQRQPGPSRGMVRAAVVWDAVQDELGQLGGLGRVLDLGGGTGGFAVRVAGLGHHVTVVDPSPDALASLQRRAAESGVDTRIAGIQGDATDLLDHLGSDSIDMVLCHGVLEVVDDPVQTLMVVREVLHQHGALSLLVAHRPAAALARALAGQVEAVRDLLLAPSTGSGSATGPRRFTESETLDLVRASGLVPTYVHGIRVFTDVVPGALVDSEPRALETLLDCERLAANRPELRALAGQLHVGARRS
ncbi:MAG: methyltransferase domain-containing protein [Nocardioidaceae bacterium]